MTANPEDICLQKQSPSSFWQSQYVERSGSSLRKSAPYNIQEYTSSPLDISREIQKELKRSPTLKYIVKRNPVKRILCEIEVPEELNKVADVIEKSRAMLDLQDDWDGEGSSGYSEETWKRAATFLLQNSIKLWRTKSTLVDTPAMQKGPEGSIDISWRTAKAKLLINVPTEMDEPATYYGIHDKKLEVKGNLDLIASNEWLLMWLRD